MSHDAPSAAPGATPYPSSYPAPPAGYVERPAAPAPYAGWWSRVGASILDGLVDSVGYVLGGIVALATAQPAVDTLGDPTMQPSAAGAVALVVGLLVTVGVTVWNRYLRQGRTGRSVGKSALGLRLVSARTGEPIGAGMAFGRDVAHLLDGIVYLGYLWPLWDPMKQTFADKIVHSVVVRAR